MNCDKGKSQNCVCDIVFKIAQKQKEINTGCKKQILSSNPNILDTVPLLFYL